MNNENPSDMLVVLVSESKETTCVRKTDLERVDPHLLDRLIAASTSRVISIGPEAELRPIQLSDTTFDLFYFVGFVAGKWPVANNTPFTLLALWLRMAAKYEVDDLALSVIKQLKQIFPTTLAAWDARDRYRCRHSFGRTDVFQAFNLLRALGERYGALELLPAALYACCQIKTQALGLGGMRVDHTPETLSLSDYELVLRTKAKLRVYGAKLVERLASFTVSPDCVRPSGKSLCAQFVADFLHFPDVVQDGAHAVRDVLAGDLFAVGFLGYIHSWYVYSQLVDEHELGACEKCLEATYEQYNALRAEVWQGLPAFAGIPQPKLPHWGRSNV